VIAAQRGKSATKRHTVKRTRKRSKRGSERKGRQENVQNSKRSVVGHRKEKVDMHKHITVKVLLDSGAIGIFMDREMAQKHDFKMMKLKRPLRVKNVDGTKNSGGKITHQVEVNIFYKNHVKRMRMDVCNLRKTEVILGMPWLQAYNSDINWKTGEVKMTRCPPLCRRNMTVKEDIEWRKKIGKRIRNVKKTDRDE